MLSEFVIALVWAAGGVAFYGATGGLYQAISNLGQSGVVYDISTGMLGCDQAEQKGEETVLIISDFW